MVDANQRLGDERVLVQKLAKLASVEDIVQYGFSSLEQELDDALQLLDEKLAE